MNRVPVAISCLVAMCLSLATPAFAQTADGITSDESGRSAASAEQTARTIEALSLYERKFYQLALRSWAIGVPSFVLGWFFDAHERQWNRGAYNFNYGLEFTARIPQKYDIIVGLDWTDMRTADGYWLEGGDPIVDANWGENTLSLLTLDVGFQWYTDLNRRRTLQLYYGLGIGASLVLGEFRKYDIIAASCGPDFVANRDSGRTELLENCYDSDGNPTIGTNFQRENIPPVLPSINATLGFRVLMSNAVSLSFEGGFKGYFFGGVKLGFFWETQPKIP